MGFNRNYFIIIVAATAAVGGMFLLPQQSSSKKEKTADAQQATSSLFNITQFMADSKSRLQPGDLIKLEKFSAFTQQADYDSAAALWDKAGIPAIAATVFEKKAAADKTEISYLNAAYRYFDGFKMAEDSLERSYFVDKAIENYNKVLALNSENLNAKTDLGICYAEGTSNPMKGITLLREVVQKDPKHENAQLNLGFLSVKSRQFDKALERFNKVLEINPGRIDTYVFIGQTYLQMGDKEKAIQSFENFKSLSNNDKAIAEIDAYLKELKAQP